MKDNSRNIRIVALSKGCIPGFDIYIDFSGQREYLVSHSHNGMLYKYLSKGVVLPDMRRNYSSLKSSRSKNSQKLAHMTRHLIAVADSYIQERNIPKVS